MKISGLERVWRGLWGHSPAFRQDQTYLSHSWGMLLWVVLKIPFTTNEPHCFFALTLWKFIIVCNLPVPNNFLYSWKSAIARFCWIWCEDFFMGLSYHSPAYTHIMRSLFLLFFFVFLIGNSMVGWLRITVSYVEFPRYLFAELLSGQTCPGRSYLSVGLLTCSGCIKCLVFQSSFSKYFLFIIYSPQKSSHSQFHIFIQKKHLISPNSFGTGDSLYVSSRCREA